MQFPPIAATYKRPSLGAYVMSFIKAPIGFLVNFLCTVTCYIPWVKDWIWLDHVFSPLAEMFCIKDGIQDDVMF